MKRFLEEERSRSCHIFTFAAKNHLALEDSTRNLFSYLRKGGETSFSDIAYTLHLTQPDNPYKMFFVVSEKEGLTSCLKNNDPKKTFSIRNQPLEKPEVVFMFPGQGSPYNNISRGFYFEEALFKEYFDLCANKFSPLLGVDLRDFIFSNDASWMDNIFLSQPILFTIGYSLAKLWMSWGIHPSAMLGYSQGEFVAAVLSGVMTFDDMVYFISKTSKILRDLPIRGGMLAVNLNWRELKKHLPEGIEIASYNGDPFFVLSGNADQISLIQRIFEEKEIIHKRLNINLPFHSTALIQAGEEVKQIVSDLEINPPTIPYISCITGDWVTHDLLRKKKYWSDFYSKPMCMLNVFSLVEKKLNTPIYVELGAGKNMCIMAKENQIETSRLLSVFPDLKTYKNEPQSLLFSLGKAWLNGVMIDWPAFHLNETKKFKFIPKTIDSKTYSENTFSFLSSSKKFPKNKKEKLFLSLFSKVLGIEEIGVTDNFFALGGDSLTAMQCVAEICRHNVSLTLNDFLKAPTARELSKIKTLSCSAHKKEKIHGAIPMLPLQIKFFQKPTHWKTTELLSVLIQTDRHIVLGKLERACQLLIDHHDSLRSRYVYKNGTWKQSILPQENVSFDYVTLSNKKKSSLDAFLSIWRAKFNLEKGPLIRFLLIKTPGPEPFLFSVLFHHLCADGVSIQILLQDLDFIYQNLISKKKVCLSNKGTSIKEFGKYLKQYARLNEAKKELCYWEKFKDISHGKIPLDYSKCNRKIMACNSREWRTTLNKDLTKQLIKSCTSQSTEITPFYVLFASLLMVLNRYTKHPTQLLHLRTHGREERITSLDLTRTVGWLTSVYPIAASFSLEKDILKSMASLKKQLTENALHGIRYGALRYLSKAKSIHKVFKEIPLPQITFNYHGQFDSLFSPSSPFQLLKWPIGNHSNPHATRSHLFNIDLFIQDGMLHLVWTYNIDFHKQETVEYLSQQYLKNIEYIISQPFTAIMQ